MAISVQLLSVGLFTQVDLMYRQNGGLHLWGGGARDSLAMPVRMPPVPNDKTIRG